jgi:hypothetical protein
MTHRRWIEEAARLDADHAMYGAWLAELDAGETADPGGVSVKSSSRCGPDSRPVSGSLPAVSKPRTTGP